MESEKLFVRQTKKVARKKGAVTHCPCPYTCSNPAPVTWHVRFHPFRDDCEIRRCEKCHKEAFFPLGKTFK
jgi:hypothetical protein